MKAIVGFLLLSAYHLNAQTTISGIVQDQNGEPIPGVNVYVKDTYDGTITSANGTFAIQTSESGEHEIIASMVGFKNYVIARNLQNAPINITIKMQEQLVTLKDVSVTASSELAVSDRQKTTVLKPIEILTTAGSNADITFALQTLPGTQQVGEQTGLFVRGGSGEETKIYIDGLAVNEFYQKGTPGVAQRGRFSPELFKGSFFSSGGYSALYGQALSSTLILESEDLPLQSSVDATLSSVGANASINLLSKDQKSSAGASLRYTNLQPYYSIVKQEREFDRPPWFGDASFNLRRKTSKTGILKFYGAYGSSAVSVFDKNIDNNAIRDLSGIDNTNIYTNLTYKEWLGRNLKINSGISFSRSIDKMFLATWNNEIEERYNGVQYASSAYQVRTVLTTFIRDVEFNFGGENWLTESNAHYHAYQGYQKQESYTDNMSAAFAESKFVLAKKLKAQLGVRAENSSYLRKANIVPRILFGYEIQKDEMLSLSYGIFYQHPDKQFLLKNPHLKDTKSAHYIVSYQKSMPGRTFRSEMFYKQYNDLVKISSDTSNAGYGYAKGIEFFWRDRKTIRAIDYWISYSFLDTKRNYLNYPVLAQPGFAADHTASLVAKKFIPAYSLTTGITYTFSSGRPYYNPNQTAEAFLTDKTKAYHNLNAMVAYMKKIKGANAIFVVSVNNVLGNRQVFGYKYSATDLSKRNEVTPLARRFIYFGIILNWGLNKGQQTVDDFLK
jgi:vitamin B12 transporter